MFRSDDPAHDWDVFCAEREAEYDDLTRGKACGDCACCERPPDGLGGYGWCRKEDDWVPLDEAVSVSGCEGFE